ncbi:Hypothetical protein SCF082_LOCUS28745 [Durusdinium trenchii]|uniref:ASCH domain-containing protein n=1 Tax=Durusdinium trenchii TaxID=1381693 RepID=A0ABP0MR81_9DINO
MRRSWYSRAAWVESSQDWTPNLGQSWYSWDWLGDKSTSKTAGASALPAGPFIAHAREAKRCAAVAGAEEVKLALTVQGPQQGLAMVNGLKQVENRSWQIPTGWYALHVGAKPLKALGKAWVYRMEEAWPDAPAEETLPSSCIIGLIRISDHRHPSECETSQKIWAVGPICHIIDEAIELPRPIPARGHAGLWPLSTAARVELLQQLPQGRRSGCRVGKRE